MPVVSSRRLSSPSKSKSVSRQWIGRSDVWYILCQWTDLHAHRDLLTISLSTMKYTTVVLCIRLLQCIRLDTSGQKWAFRLFTHRYRNKKRSGKINWTLRIDSKSWVLRPPRSWVESLVQFSLINATHLIKKSLALNSRTWVYSLESGHLLKSVFHKQYGGLPKVSLK